MQKQTADGEAMIDRLEADLKEWRDGVVDARNDAKAKLERAQDQYGARNVACHLYRDYARYQGRVQSLDWALTQIHNMKAAARRAEN